MCIRLSVLSLSAAYVVSTSVVARNSLRSLGALHVFLFSSNAQPDKFGIKESPRNQEQKENSSLTVARSSRHPRIVVEMGAKLASSSALLIGKYKYPKMPNRKSIISPNISNAFQVVVCLIGFGAAASLDSTDSNWLSGGRDGASFELKRHYLVAPRVGRSVLVPARQPAMVSSIRSSLEEGASFQSPGQIQAHLYGLPRPMKASSLLFLIGGLNRRLRSPTGTGLLPQARIGRRSVPLMSNGQGDLYDNLFASSASELPDSEDEEFAMAASTDNQALNEALESLLS